MAGAEEPPPSGLAWAGNAPWFAPPPTSEGRQGVRSRGAHCHRFVRPGPASTLHSDRRRRDKGCRISAAADMDVAGHRESEGLVGQTRTGEPPNRRRGTKHRKRRRDRGGTPPEARTTAQQELHTPHVNVQLRKREQVRKQSLGPSPNHPGTDFGSPATTRAARHSTANLLDAADGDYAAGAHRNSGASDFNRRRKNLLSTRSSGP